MLNPTTTPPPPPPTPPPPSTGRACAACKHQRKKCVDTCTFAPYFPPGLSREFDRAQKVFGVSNMAKMAGKIPAGLRGVFFESIVVEAELRYANPVTGCAGQLERMRRHNHELRHEVEKLRERLRVYDQYCPNGNSNGFANYGRNPQNLNGNGVHGMGIGVCNGNGNGFSMKDDKH